MKNISIIKRVSFYLKFLKRNHYFPNLHNPKTFNEKLNYRKFFTKNSLFTLCTDKIKVKNYVKDKIGEEYITKTLFITEKDRKSTRLNSSHVRISYAVFC